MGPESVKMDPNGLMDLIIQDGTILTMVPGSPVIESGQILVKGGRIVDVRSSPRQGRAQGPGVEVIDASGAWVLPGLVNAHCHAAMTLFRGMADDLPLSQWLFEKIFPAEARILDRETVYWGALLGCLEMLASGTTAVMDGYFFQDATAEALLRTGLRGLIAQGVIDFPAPGVPDPADNLKEARAFVERWQGVSDRLVPGIFCHSPLTCSAETLAGAMEISRDYGVPLQCHVSETAAEVKEILDRYGKRPAFHLDEAGVLGSDFVAVHAVHLDRDEISLFSERGAGVVHVPESNMKLGCGAAPVKRMLEAGLRIGLGTDGCASNNNLDLLQEMDTAAKLAKLVEGDPTCMDAETILAMTCSGGASLMGMEHELGTLEPGKRADIVVVDAGKPHLQPCYNPYSNLVYSAGGADVRDVIIDGRVLIRDKHFLYLDPEEIIDEVRRIASCV